MPVEAEVPENLGDDLRNDLSAAIEQAEAATPPVEAPPPAPVEAGPTEPVGPATPETPEETSARLRDEKGRFAKSDSKPILTPSEKPEQAGIKPTPIAPEQATPAPSIEPLKAPASFKALAREEWGKTPQAIQQEVIRRERETAVALEQSAEARQGYQRFREVVAPYEAMIRGSGADPYQTVQNLLQTAAGLATAPVQRRAEILAGLIKAYLPGRDSLEVLDSTLAGVMQGRPATSAPPQYASDPRVDEIYQAIQQAKAQQAQTLEQQAIEGVRTIQGEEFYEDVKLIVADMLEVAGNQGIALTPRDAYTRAVLVHPEVSKVVEQRQRQKLAGNPSGSIARARAAASSVRGNPATAPGGVVQPDDLRSVVEAAFDRAGR